MAAQCRNELARPPVPQPHRAVKGRRREPRAVGGEGRRVDELHMPGEPAERTLRVGRPPQEEREVIGAGGNQFRATSLDSLVPLPCRLHPIQRLSRRLAVMVIWTRAQRSIRVERQAVDPVRMAVE